MILFPFHTVGSRKECWLWKNAVCLTWERDVAFPMFSTLTCIKLQKTNCFCSSEAHKWWEGGRSRETEGKGREKLRSIELKRGCLYENHFLVRALWLNTSLVITNLISAMHKMMTGKTGQLVFFKPFLVVVTNNTFIEFLSSRRIQKYYRWCMSRD